MTCADCGEPYVATLCAHLARRPARCDACVGIARRVRGNDWKVARYGSHRAFNLWHKYGLTVEAFDSMVTAQGGRCAICDRVPDALHVDHSHATGRVRGLVCFGCNSGMGALGDDPARLRAAADYLDLFAVAT